MDFHGLARKDLQFLCKRNRIPANQTNIAMANSLQALKTVEGIEEIQEPLGFQSQKKTVAKPSPDVSRTTSRISARRAAHGNDPKIQQQSPVPQSKQVKGKALEVTFMASKDVEGEKPEPPKIYPKTPATRKAGKGPETSRSWIRAKTKEEGSCERTPKIIEAGKGKTDAVVPRRSARLSSLKPVDETATAQSKSRRMAKEKEAVNKMGSLGCYDEDEKEMVEGKNELPSNAEEEAVDNNQNVENYGLSSSLGEGVSKAEAIEDSRLLLANELVKESSYKPIGNELPTDDSGSMSQEKEKVDFSGEPSPGNDVVIDSGNLSLENETVHDSVCHTSGLNELQEETYSWGVETAQAVETQDASCATMAAEISIREAAVKLSVQVEDNLHDAGEIAPKEPIDVPQKTESFPSTTLEPQLIASLSELCNKLSLKDELQSGGKNTANEPVTSQEASIEPEETGARLTNELTGNDSVDVPQLTVPIGYLEMQIPGVSAGLLPELKISELAAKESVNMLAPKECDVQNKIPEEEDSIHTGMEAAAAIATISSLYEELPGDTGELSILHTPLLDSVAADTTATDNVEEKAEIKSVEKEKAQDATEIVEEEESKSVEKEKALDATEKVERETKSVEKVNVSSYAEIVEEEIKSEDNPLAAAEMVEEEIKSVEKENVSSYAEIVEEEEIKSKDNPLAAAEIVEEKDEIKSVENSLAATETAEEEEIISETVEEKSVLKERKVAEEIKSEKENSLAAAETVEEKEKIKSVDKENSLDAAEIAEEEEIKSETVEKEDIKPVEKENSQAATSTDTVKEKVEIKPVDYSLKEENLESKSLGQLRAMYKNKVIEKKSMINQEEVLDLEFSGSIKLDSTSVKKRLNQEKIKLERKKFVIKQEDCLSQSKSDSNRKKILNKLESNRTPLKNLNCKTAQDEV